MPSRVLKAQCAAGVVQIGGVPVPVAEVLSEGVASSQGLAVLDGEDVTYIPSSATDIKQVIEKVNDLITKVINILTPIDAATNSPGANAAAISTLTSANVQFALLKDMLK